MPDNICVKIDELELQLAKLPDAWLVYKTIHNKKQPYLQWHEEGKTKSRYVKQEDREQILMEIRQRDAVKAEYEKLCAWRDHLKDCWKAYPGLGPQSRMICPASLGYQSFRDIMEKRYFYVDKSMFLKEWWEDRKQVDLILRPRRFGKTLNLDMTDCFFSINLGSHPEWFEDLQIWRQPGYRELQGSVPVIHLNFGAVKTKVYEEQLSDFQYQIEKQYLEYQYILEDGRLSERESAVYDDYFERIRKADPAALAVSIAVLSELIYSYWHKKVIVLIDEYDTPTQEAWQGEDRQRVMDFVRKFFNYTLKNNPYLEKALVTGITRISQESMFSDMNNVQVSAMSDDRFTDSFGFTEEEVFASMDSQQMAEKMKVKEWYDGFRIGNRSDIYNPWSISNYLASGVFEAYWVNTSSDAMAGDLIRRSGGDFKEMIRQLLTGGTIEAEVREDMVYQEMGEAAVWGLLYSAGYLKALNIDRESGIYTLTLTNHEVQLMMERLFRQWFEGRNQREYDDFIEAMLAGNTGTMNECLSEIAWETFSFFDVGGRTASRTAENFYHGFFLGLVSSLRKEYRITSNRESGRGRYDCMLEPVADHKKAVVLEFKVRRSDEESLKASAEAALKQIEEKRYVQEMISRGFAEEQILRYGIAFEGKDVLVMGESQTN